MAKNMARLENNQVINIEHCSDYEKETATLKDCKDVLVAIGDTYSNGEYFRNGERVPTVVDILVQQRTAEMDELMSIIDGTTPIEESEEISDVEP